MNTMTIEYFTKNVYGSKRMYFAKKNQRISFSRLSNKMTFDDTDKWHIINLLADSGIKVVFNEVLESAAE